MEQETDETTLRLRLPSLTLGKSDIQQLSNIVIKAASGSKGSLVRLIVSGDRESVRTNSIDKLITARWPEEIDAASLEAFDDEKLIKLSMSSHAMGANEAIISSRDSDWVTTRVKEIEDFISEHKNWHWICFNVPVLSLTSLALGAMIGAGMALGLNLSFEGSVLAGGIGLMASVSIMGQLHKIYPYVLIEGGRPSAKSKLRKFLRWVISALVASIVINLIWQVVTQLIAR